MDIRLLFRRSARIRTVGSWCDALFHW